MDYFKRLGLPKGNNPCILIPARYNSSRLPGKPLVNICGVPAIERVLKQAQLSGFPSFVVTDHRDICPGPYRVLVEDETANGTERCAIAVRRYKMLQGYDAYIILAGDELCATAVMLQWFNRAMQRQLSMNKHGVVGTVITDNPRYSYVRTNHENRVQAISRQPIGGYEGTGIYYYSPVCLGVYMDIDPFYDYEGIELNRMVAGSGWPVIPQRITEHPGLSLNTPEDIKEIEAWLSS